MKSLFSAISIAILYLATTSFQLENSLTGTWEYRGGIYGYQKKGAAKGVVIHRVYADGKYEGFITVKGKTQKYEAGTFTMHDKNYIETQTFSNGATAVKGKAIHYTFAIKNNTITFKGTVNKSPVEEYWKKMK